MQKSRLVKHRTHHPYSNLFLTLLRPTVIKRVGWLVGVCNFSKHPSANVIGDYENILGIAISQFLISVHLSVLHNRQNDFLHENIIQQMQALHWQI